ncbi:MAG: phosphopentomutase [Neisseriaceae bacterium]
MSKRAIIIVLDSFGIGCLPDSKKFGDYGSNTLGHIDEYAYKNNISFQIPNLLSLGLGAAYYEVNNKKLFIDKNDYNRLTGYYGACKEVSSGKDTTSGHWEIAGLPVLFDWGYFTDLENSFPKELLAKIVEQTQISGYLGNCHASGTEIIKNLGMEHIKTGKPIFYTSADSVFQIACHEKYFGLERLYEVCHIVRKLIDPYNIARVIARPFIGESPETFLRTGNRRDYSVIPHGKTLLDRCKDSGGDVIAIGKIGDIYTHMGTTHEIHASGLQELCDETIKSMKAYTKDKAIIMTNLVDFDMQYGHRRDTLGYKNALEYFDMRLPEIISYLSEDDILVLTADHGCDPTWHGSDHTREHIPFLMYHNGENKNIGIRDTYADIGQTVATHLGLDQLLHGVSVLI